MILTFTTPNYSFPALFCGLRLVPTVQLLPFPLLNGRLLLPHGVVPPLKGKQFVVGAAFDYVTLVKHHDLVRGGDGGETVSTEIVRKCLVKEIAGALRVIYVRDGNRSSSSSNALKCVLDLSLGMRIERSSGFVQEQDASVFKDGSGNGDLLVS